MEDVRRYVNEINFNTELSFESDIDRDSFLDSNGPIFGDREPI